MAVTATATHTKTLIAPDSGAEDKIYGSDYVSLTSHSVVLSGLGTAAEAATTDFEPAGAITAHVALADPHTQYLLETAAGAVVGGTDGSILFISGGVVAQDNANFKWGTTAGQGLTANAGTATTDVGALRATQTWNNAAITYTGIKYTITDTASAAGSLALQVLGGAAGTTNLFSIQRNGNLIAGDGDATTLAFISVNGGGNAAKGAYIQFGKAGTYTSAIGHRSAIAGGGTSTSLHHNVASGDTHFFSINGAAKFEIGASASLVSGVVQLGTTGTGLSEISAGLVGVGTGAAASFAGSLKLTDLIAVGKISLDGSFGTEGQVATSHGASPATWETPSAGGGYDSALGFFFSG